MESYAGEPRTRAGDTREPPCVGLALSPLRLESSRRGIEVRPYAMMRGRDRRSDCAMGTSNLCPLRPNETELSDREVYHGHPL